MLKITRSTCVAVLSFSGAALAQVALQPRMGDPVPGLTAVETERFARGRVAFEHKQTLVEGLGPIFNRDRCLHCHAGPAAGGGSGITVTRIGVAAVGAVPFDPLIALGGGVLQTNTVALPGCQEFVPVQANVVSPRISPPLFGLGLVEAITDVDIQVREFIPPPGVSGRANIMTPIETPLGQARVGRFGWKAQIATILNFTADASMQELGLSNRFFPLDNAPNAPAVAFPNQPCDSVMDPEDGPDAQGFHKIDRMTDFVRFLAPPPQTPRAGMTGALLFDAIGCAKCHVSTTYTTSPLAPEAALANQAIRPYSDFLLHDLGDALADGIPDGLANTREMRTPPLWGLRFRAPVALLHDGRAAGQNSIEANLELALLAHGGEAAATTANYVGLSASDKAQLYKFLLSLGRAEFDFADDDNLIDLVDWFFMRPFVTGPGAHFTADDPVAVCDFDGDGDLDLRDLAAFQRAFVGL
ncbi:MAG: hypothetical protein JNL28_01060 [Planctomycetes bacterium]|nr:hypothetical protein [Planctomycetota bacterium]